jgi:hypothetical protein
MQKEGKMNYQKQYDLLIDKHGSLLIPDFENYYERHHIKPKSLGGSNEIVNLTYLDLRCHLLAHWLLMNIHKNAPMRAAFTAMCVTREGTRLTSRMYAMAREAVMGENSAVSKKVHTPKGWFGSVRLAAKAHNTCSAVISKKCKSKSQWLQDYHYEVFELKEEQHMLTGRGKRVHTPNGWFDSVRQAASSLGMYHSTVSKNCQNLVPGYFYEEECAFRPVAAKRKVHTPLGWFDSVAAAARAHEVKGPGTISSRCKAKWPDYYYS